MKKILILGAGMVVKPMAHYLLDNNYAVTLASRTKEKAEKVLKGYTNGEAISWTMDEIDILDQLIKEHDIIVSLLPYTYHVAIAEKCIAHKKNMLTTSYVSQEMAELNTSAKNAGILILNELGVDPGYDHMTAMEIIDRVHAEEGKIDEFYSLCGALCAPEASNNPFRYKFSWSPKGVVMASNNGAQFLKNGKVVNLDTTDLFKDPLMIDFPEVESMYVYPNRDSLAYIDLYGIPEVTTMYRGTFRYENWCEALDLLKALKLTDYGQLNLKGKTFAQVTAELNNLNAHTLKEDIKERFNIDDEHQGLKAIEWLGVLDAGPVHLEQGSAFDLTSDLMVHKMMMEDSERDMVLMQHTFRVTRANGQKENIVSRMLNYGNQDYTAIARTVALPAAIGVKMILEGKINEKGVQIPIKKTIYTPILAELKKLGISMMETIEN
ncbi:saccharopine dehydrogenase C-terminal domain-containing protein [Spongiimicrobium sp. 3-5]|uniref:saccharopine dehydrogenase C-terminal domain-containing protein n=1 Tax=Spongiimicrobium sp. 3-5 TaxID=3332596 RepID=UPI003980EC7D